MAQDLQYDGQASFEGGQDSSLPASRISDGKFAAGVNISTAKGIIKPRYGYNRIKLKLPTGFYNYAFGKIITYENIFYGGKFQALTPYRIGNKEYLVIVVSGIIFLVDLITYNVTLLTKNPTTQLSESAPRINWTAAGRFLVIYDYPSLPVIVDGYIAHRSNREKYEVPVANMGAYNDSRLFFSNSGNDFTAGDPKGNPLTPDAPITVEEIETATPYFADVYSTPSDFDSPITAMARIEAVDTSTGIGSLITGTEDQIFAFNTTVPRERWLAGQFGSSISSNAGIVSQRAFVNVNSDGFFISSDGMLRSLSMSRDEQKKYARVPMSVEVENWLSYRSPELIKYSTLCYFKNKIFWTVRPYRIPASRLNGNKILDVAHSGMLVLELDNVARLGSDAAPAWAGLWTGINPMDMCSTSKRMFVMSKDKYSRNNLYEVRPDLTCDRADNQKRQIKSILYTREHFWKDLFAIKDLQNVEVGITDIKGKFDLKIEWKPSDLNNFILWKEFKHEAQVDYKNIEGGKIPQKSPVSFKELKFGLPEYKDIGHPVTREKVDKVKRMQLKFTVSGEAWQFNEYRIGATLTKDTSPRSIDNQVLEDNTEEKIKVDDWYYEEFSI